MGVQFGILSLCGVRFLRGDLGDLTRGWLDVQRFRKDTGAGKVYLAGTCRERC